MLIHLKNLLTAREVHEARALLQAPGAPWIDGRASAGGQAVRAKNNQQLAQDSAAAATLRERVLAAVRRDPLFLSAALPKKIFNPLFNRYGGEANAYGAHVDNAVLNSRVPQQQVRTDLSCTLFLCDPDDYDGGELLVHDLYAPQSVKLPAGDAILYPGTSVHEVRPVTRGARLASFFWIESMVRSGEQRDLLFDMDMTLLALRRRDGESEEATRLAGTYHNLLRMWSDT